MNFLGIVQRVWRESGRAGSGPVTLAGATGDAVKIADRVNDAYAEIQRMPREWRWMRGTALLDLPAQTLHSVASLGVDRLGKFIDEDEEYYARAATTAAPGSAWKLYQMDWSRFNQNFVAVDHAVGPPQFWSVSPAGELAIGPPPDAVYRFRFDYRRTVHQLQVDTDAPEMPEEFHMAVTWRALAEVASDDSAPEIYSRAVSNYDNLLTDLVDDQAQRIGVRWRPE